MDAWRIFGLLLDRANGLHDLGVVVAQIQRTIAAEEVQILPALLVHDGRAVRFDEPAVESHKRQQRTQIGVHVVLVERHTL